MNVAPQNDEGAACRFRDDQHDRLRFQIRGIFDNAWLIYQDEQRDITQ